ncbi:MAG: chalcone isomerase family protein [Thauera sp.]|nr:chalcone isomerase family protein [Thauera sp.]
MSTRILRSLIAAALLSAGFAQAAITVGNVDFATRQTVQQRALELNGAGLRTRLGFKVYAMGLYLRAPLAEAGAILADKGEKRIRIVPIRDLEAKQFADALQAGLEKNHDDATLAALKPATDALLAALAAVGEVKTGTEIVLDRLGNGATRLLVDAKQHGEDIADPALYPALLRIWLGERPADSELREALLKKPQ